jgi:S1-C subfamily serine protease
VRIVLDGKVATGVIVHVNRDSRIADGFYGYCLTAYHVVEDDKRRQAIEVQYRNGRKSRKCAVVAVDQENDVALISVWVPESYRAASLASKAVEHGDRLTFMGLGGDKALDCCVREFTARASISTNPDLIYADTLLLPGDSGGPIFDERGAVAGAISGGWFWIDKGHTTPDGSRLMATWPARGANLGPIQKLVNKVISREPSAALQANSELAMAKSTSGQAGP